MTLNSTNLFSEAYNIVYTFLKNNISDPRNRYKANWIHASEPYVNAKSFSGYPYLVLSVNVSESTKSHDGVTSNKEFRYVIEVVSDEPTEVDSISDEIFSESKQETNLTELKSKTLGSSELTWTLDANGKKAYRRAIGLIGVKRI